MGVADTTGTVNLYIEDCLFNNLWNQAIDLDDASRVTVRNTTLNNSQGTNHGTTGLQGAAHFELYNCVLNYFPIADTPGTAYGTWLQTAGGSQTPPNGGKWPALSRWWWWRAGTALIHDNQITQINNFGFWGGGLSWQFTNEDLTRPGTGTNGTAELNSDYQAANGGGWHWCGTMGNHVGDTSQPVEQMPTTKTYRSYQILVPVYIWNNTVGGVGPLPDSSNWSTIDETGYGHDPVAGTNTTADTFLVSRNIFFTAPPANLGNVTGSYAPYAYPHPLRSGVPSGGGGGGGGGQPPAQPDSGVGVFHPPAFWGKYPPYGAPQTSKINTAKPKPPDELGPSYGALGGQMMGIINTSGSPVPPQSINSGV
jgi:hypothetical protein